MNAELMSRRVLLAMCMVLPCACAFDRTGANPSGDGGATPDADPAGIIDSGVDAPPGQCVVRCDGDTLFECPGGVEAPTNCPAGCVAAGGPHCGEVVPSNGVTTADFAGADGKLRVREGETATFEADTGRIVIGGIEVRAAGEGVDNGVRYESGPPYNVFTFEELRIDRGGTVLMRAPASPSGVTSPVILHLSGEAGISGLIDITAGCADTTMSCAGVGGGNGGTSTLLPGGCAPGKEGGAGTLLSETGGGGGGFGQNGAAGGDNIDFLGGAGGTIGGCADKTLVPLEGGSGGDRGGEGGNGGGGGGGLQITSHTRIAIEPDGGGGVTPGVWAGGGGGDGGGIGSGGGGGGSGGGILLDAPVINLAVGAVLAANGGGGGEGNGSGDGQRGLLANMAAGGGGGTIEQHGGKGGFGSTQPEQGDGPGDGTGGGGGGAGRIRINGHSVTADATFSPPPSLADVTVQ
jgi:hypothetical protein